MTVLVVDGRLPFAELAAAGWRRADIADAPAPLIAGEPEDGEWLRDDARLRYYFERDRPARAATSIIGGLIVFEKRVTPTVPGSLSKVSAFNYERQRQGVVRPWGSTTRQRSGREPD